MTKLPALNYCEETIELVHNIEEAFLSLGERLYKIRNEKMWEGRWDSYDDFLMDIKISRARESKLVSIYEKYVLEYKIEPEKLAKVNWSNLYTMLPAVKDKKSAEEWVEKGSVMFRKDIEDEVREVKRGGPCEHEFERIVLDKCTKCFKSFRVYEE